MPPPDLHDLSYAEMKALVAELLGRVAELTRTVAELREENVRLKGLKGPDIKPSALSGMERASQGKPLSQEPRRGGGNKTAKRVIHETRIVKASVPCRGFSVNDRARSYLTDGLTVSGRASTQARRQRTLTFLSKRILLRQCGGLKSPPTANHRRFSLSQEVFAWALRCAVLPPRTISEDIAENLRRLGLRQ
jgi:hypothetical protein